MCSRQNPFIQTLASVKLWSGKKKTLSQPESALLSGNDYKERTEMSNNNNQLNIPQAKEAMNKFKMQAASDEDVSSTS